MSEIHRTYEDECKKSKDYDVDGYNNYLEYQYKQYPYGRRDKNEDEEK